MNKLLELIPKTTFESYNENNRVNMYKEPSLVLGVIDSVFSISSKYESTIKVVDRFIELIKIDRKNDDYTTANFI